MRFGVETGVGLAEALNLRRALVLRSAPFEVQDLMLASTALRPAAGAPVQTSVRTLARRVGPRASPSCSGVRRETEEAAAERARLPKPFFRQAL
jgi:hypothetical protein